MYTGCTLGCNGSDLTANGCILMNSLNVLLLNAGLDKLIMKLLLLFKVRLNKFKLMMSTDVSV